MLTVLQGRFLGNAFNDDGAGRYQNSAGLLLFMRRTTILHFSFLIQEKLSNAIKGEMPRGLTLKPNDKHEKGATHA